MGRGGITTLAPSAARRREIALPIPLEPPVTIATLPARVLIDAGISEDGVVVVDFDLVLCARGGFVG